MSNAAVVLLSMAAGGVGLCTLLGFCGRWWWRLDLFSHFRAQYALLLAAAAVAFGLLGRLELVILSGLFGLVNLGLLLPFYMPTGARPKEAKTYRLLACNVLQENQQYAHLIELIQRLKPDFIILLEVGEHWIEALKPLDADYPHCVNEFWGEENYDIALMSRIAPQSLEVQRFGPTQVPTVVGRYLLDGKPLTLIGTHPAPPKTKAETEARNAQLAALAPFAAAQASAVIMAGDLNITSWSPFFGDFVRRSGLRDSRLGMGHQPSWPVNSPLMRIPIDHALVSAQVEVQRRWLEQPIGSDHFPVVLDFSLREMH